MSVLLAFVTAHVVGLIPKYLDPGSGSIIFQAVVGGVMAVGLAFRVGWRKVKGLFVRGEQ